MRPGTCGVTVTDSNAPLRPTSSRYVGTARETAGAVVTSGGSGGGAAALAFPRLHAAVAVTTPSTLRRPTNEAKRSLSSVIGCRAQTRQLPVQRQSPESKDRARSVQWRDLANGEM